MIYPYMCRRCDLEKEVVKPASEYNTPEKCDRCGEEMGRIFTPFLFHGAKNEEAEWNPAFGKVIKNKRERKYEAEKRGMIEIGNEKLDSLHNHFDKQREQKRENNWQQALSEVL